MKVTTLENIFNHERFICNNMHDTELIDGVEYLKISKLGSTRILLMRKDSLKKIEEKKMKNNAGKVFTVTH